MVSLVQAGRDSVVLTLELKRPGGSSFLGRLNQLLDGQRPIGLFKRGYGVSQFGVKQSLLLCLEFIPA